MKCNCTSQVFNRSWFDVLPAVIERTVDAAANATHQDPTASYAYIPTKSKAEYPYTWDTCAGIEHAWHPSLVKRFKLHPVVDAMLAHRPANIAQLALEWPHVADSDGKLLAYTRDDAKGHADIQTTTSIGKYVARHWPSVPDHIRRDACSLYTADKCRLLTTTAEFIDAVQNGPASCMQGNFDVHPYSVYTPALGWGMAVRLSSGCINGRALTYVDPDATESKTFVRTYGRDAGNGYSHADEMLAAWLMSQGYKKVNSWDGCEVAVIRHDGQYVMPYLDGNSQKADLHGSTVFSINDDGEYGCSNTGGYADDKEEESIGSCEHCSDTIEEDDSYSMVGRDEDCMVCSDCCDRRYTYVTGAGRRGNEVEYYVRDDCAVTVNDTSYDEDNLPSNICLLEDGDYFDSEADDYCIIDDEYYLCDDSRVVCCADGEYRLKDDCWECAESGEWYSDDEDFVDVDGETYHADSLAALNAAEQVAPLFPELAIL